MTRSVGWIILGIIMLLFVLSNVIAIGYNIYGASDPGTIANTTGLSASTTTAISICANLVGVAIFSGLAYLCLRKSPAEKYNMQ